MEVLKVPVDVPLTDSRLATSIQLLAPLADFFSPDRMEHGRAKNLEISIFTWWYY